MSEPTVREQLEVALRSFGDGIAMPPRYEISWELQADGSVRYTIRDNRPGPDSIVLKMLELQVEDWDLNGAPIGDAINL